MSAIIGTIKAVMGQVWIVASDGTRRLATEGEQVMRGEVVVTDQGAATITLPNGKDMDLGRGSEWGSDATAISTTADVDAQAIAASQQAIAEGADPTQVLEATAAGNSPIIDSSSAPTGAESGHTHVILDLTGEILDPTAGYPTEGLDTSVIAPVEEITLIRPEADTSSDETVTPPTQPTSPITLPEASITIDMIAGDNVINRQEAAQEKTAIGGTTGKDVRPGDTVTVTINGNQYQTQVDADGRWSVEVNTSDLVAAGDVHASVTTYDQYGNQASASADSAVSIDTMPPTVTITIDLVTGDGVINQQESEDEFTELTGKVTGRDVVQWDEVQITIGDQTYTAVVQEDLSWSVKVPTSQLQDGTEIEASVTGYDKAGNSADDTDTTEVSLDLSAPEVTITIDLVTGDGVINQQESEDEFTELTGKVTGRDVVQWDEVQITIGDQTYTAVVQEDLSWSVKVPTSQLQDGTEIEASVTGYDQAGNSADDTDTTEVSLDLSAPEVTITIDLVTGDGVINQQESEDEFTELTGKVTGRDVVQWDEVQITIGDQTYTAVVQEDLSWSVKVPTSQLQDGTEIEASVTGYDQAGNSADDTDTTDVSLDLSAPEVTITIDLVTGDGVINQQESEDEFTELTGKVTGRDVVQWDEVQITIGDQTYTAVVQEDLSWSVKVPTSQLQDGTEIEASVTGYDKAGNSADDTDTTEVSLDLSAPEVTITIDLVTGDGVINQMESQDEFTELTGKVTGRDVVQWDEVQITIGDQTYTAVVQEDLSWSVKVPTSQLQDGTEIEASVTGYDKAGNSADDTDTTEVSLDLSAPEVTITIDLVTGDGVINQQESEDEFTELTGKVTGREVVQWDEVQITIGDQTYTAVVQEDLSWSVKVPTSQLQDGTEIEASVTGYDKAGNSADDTDTTDVSLDLSAPEVTITIDLVTGDGVINQQESEDEFTELTGKVTGRDVVQWDEVQITIGDQTYTAIVQEDLSWSVKVPTSQLQDGTEIEASVTGYDKAGNSADDTDTTEVSLDLSAPEVTITIDLVTGDGVINQQESEDEFTELTGKVTGRDVVQWDEVQITIGDQTYTAVVQEDLSWSVKVPTSQLQDGTEIEASVTGYDKAGNSADDTDTTDVSIDINADVEIFIDPITGDDYLDISETTHWQGQEAPTTTITGYVTGEATENDTVSITVNNKTYDNVALKQVGDKLVWELTVDTADLVETPKVDASITITDAAGNTATDHADRTVDSETATEQLGTAADDTIHGNEGSSNVIIGDVEGFQAQPGQDYNIAFLVDTSGSVSSSDIKALIASLKTVFSTLAAGTEHESSGTLNILLVDFDSKVQFAYDVSFSADMTEAQRDKALNDLYTQLNKMTSGGSTNYGAAFESAADWFSQFEGDDSTNLTYFITDGKPTIFTGTTKVVDVDARSNYETKLDMSTLQYQPGTAVTLRINGVNREVIDKNGNVYEWNGSSKTKIGTVVSDGAGGYTISGSFGNGTASSANNPNLTYGSMESFALLLAVCGSIEALGVNSAIGADDLKAYDSDGNVQTDIKANELADAILGKNDVRVEGAEDIVQGKSGNDIIFGDAVEFAGIAGNGFTAIRELIAKEMGVSVTSITSAHIHQYITEHPDVFDMSRTDGGDDILFGGAGNDIIYGGGGEDILAGGDGDDLLYGGVGNDILFGDGYNAFSELFDYIAGKLGTENITLADVQKYITDNSHEFDISAPGGGDDILHGGSGNDILYGGGGNDILHGDEGNDLLYGGTGDDILIGGAGNDILIGGQGNDTLYGGSGSDTFTWLKGDGGHDVIKDFRADEGDRIDLSDLLGDIADTDLASYIRVTNDDNGNAVIEINTNGQMQNNGSTMSITVENCSSADIDINSLIAKPDAPVL
ncbi:MULTISPECIES: retention module-containing protein [unclassified Klebsiella]|uniref:retention module-containing protein n=1 Tax=Enterobacteriaceae TaxID=543 RepID=UPI0015DCB322|nr:MULTISPECIES: retention module-containing protein [unclassified Klebsiella]BBS90202.1 hypothetical protein WP7S18C02_08170 [Klebsiella sp. WP7-S18-CRE-02]BBS95224.1 hypothetical protein WP7S18C03_08170 [Klebsiella sp. WP7-S18-CRE-03]BBT00256.1 hypothetical protein WP7S18E04_08180 [Klebsiella sp. WP7-S18-ESBL-04]